MNNNNFQFSTIGHVEIFTFDQSLEHFRQQMIDGGADAEGTIREIIQNSLDAKNYESNEPVKVDLTVTTINKSDIPGINEIFTHIQALKPGNHYTSETVKHMKKKEVDQQVTVLTAEDSNTLGLTGAEDSDGGTYAVYACSC